MNGTTIVKVEEPELIEAQEVHGPEMSKRQEFVKGLRDLAALYEREILLPLPNIDVTVNLFPEREQLPIIARCLGKCEKDVLTDQWFLLRKSFGRILKIEANWNRREVCTRVVVGKETVKQKVAVSFEEKEVEREIVEWHCPGSVAQIPSTPAELPTEASTNDIPF